MDQYIKSAVLGQANKPRMNEGILNMIRAAIFVSNDGHGNELMEKEVSFVNPISRNNISGCKSTYRAMEVDNENSRIVAVNWTGVIRRGAIPEKLEIKEYFKTKDSRLGSIHKVAANGKILLPFGIGKSILYAAVPKPASKFQDNFEDNNEILDRSFPVSVNDRILNFL